MPLWLKNSQWLCGPEPRAIPSFQARGASGWGAGVWAYLKAAAVRIAVGGGSLQTVSWLFGVDDLVHAWLLSNQLLVLFGLATYIVIGAVTVDAQRRLQQMRYREELWGAAVPPPRLLPRPKKGKKRKD